MNPLIAILILTLFSLQSEAKKQITLDDAVNTAKSKGRVLSAKTVSGNHEVKILTSDGSVKTLVINSGKSGFEQKSTLMDTRSDHNYKRHDSRNQRSNQSRSQNLYKSRQNVMKLNPRQPNVNTTKRGQQNTKGKNKNK